MGLSDVTLAPKNTWKRTAQESCAFFIGNILIEMVTKKDGIFVKYCMLGAVFIVTLVYVH
jgi:hypothetical protein